MTLAHDFNTALTMISEDTDSIFNEFKGIDKALQDFIIINKMKRLPFFIETTTPNNSFYLASYEGVEPFDLQYSLDGVHWTAYPSGSGERIYLNHAGDRAYLKGNNTGFGYEDGGYYYIYASDPVIVGGNLISLVDETMTQKTLRPYAFAHFMSETSLKDVSQLVIQAVGPHAYYSMFNYNLNITKPPRIIATEVDEYCYEAMFAGCENLTEAPDLPATTLATACYRWMFQYCYKLTTPPKLPATTLADSCYYGMLEGCGLIEPPELPATTLAVNCYYQMLEGCGSLTKAPYLPATTLAASCYGYMVGSTAIKTITLPATTLASECYADLFDECPALEEVITYQTSWGSNSTSNWMSRVPLSGTFRCPAGLDTTTRDGSHVPSTWLVVNI